MFAADLYARHLVQKSLFNHCKTSGIQLQFMTRWKYIPPSDRHFFYSRSTDESSKSFSSQILQMCLFATIKAASIVFNWRGFCVIVR